jgi:hypothetical protein
VTSSECCSGMCCPCEYGDFCRNPGSSCFRDCEIMP